MAIKEFVQRIGAGEALREICKSKGVPYGLVFSWITEDPSRAATFFAAFALRAAEVTAANRKLLMCPQCAAKNLI